MNIHTDIEETARGWFVRLNGPDGSGSREPNPVFPTLRHLEVATS